MKRKLSAGSTSVDLPVFVQDTRSTTGAGLSIASNTVGLVAEYRRYGQATWTPIPIVPGTLGTFVSCGLIADGSLLGAYSFCPPNAAFSAGARSVQIRLYGAANMLPVLVEIELDAVNYQDGNRFGLEYLNISGYVASQMDVQAVRELVDTEIAAIKAKTDNLPSDPADASELASAFAAVDALLTAIAGYVDTELSAVKAVTDKLATTIVADGSVYQFTPNSLENAPSGASAQSIDVLPLNSRLEDPVEDTTITVYVDETRVVSISLWDKSLQPVDLQGLSLVFTVRDKRRNLVQTLTPTVSGQNFNTITVTLPPSVTDVVGRSLDWSLRVVGTQLVKAKGVIEVRWAP
jgi:hypothetical protein